MKGRIAMLGGIATAAFVSAAAEGMGSGSANLAGAATLAVPAVAVIWAVLAVSNHPAAATFGTGVLPAAVCAAAGAWGGAVFAAMRFA